MKTCRSCNEAKPLDAYRGTRSICLACEHARKREWYAAQATKPHQRGDMKAYYRQWYAANAETVKARAVEWQKANPDKRRDVCRENMARQRGKLNDNYVRRMLAQSIGLKAADIPQPLVEAQRELLKIKRYIREHSV
jgi:ABC-type nitrate/sulfonate/bicarbonate transport system substrate-binding protein